MRKLILALGLVASAVAQNQNQPTVYFPVLANRVGLIAISTIAIPSSYMIGQYTHTLSIILNNSGGTCNANALIVGIDGSEDNINWISLGSPISNLTGTPGVSGQLTGMTVAYGAFPFLRINIRRAFGTNCSTNLNYVGSVTPTSFPTSLAQFGEGFTTSHINNTALNGSPSLLLTQTSNVGGRISLYALEITNNDTTNATVYTVTLYNKPNPTNCQTSVSGTSEVLFTYRIPAGQSRLVGGYGSIPFYQAPDPSSNSAAGFPAYDPIQGFYQICVSADNGSLTTLNLVSRTY
jgi:hypothetical protein